MEAPVKTIDTKGFCIFCLRKVEGTTAAVPNSKKTDKGRTSVPKQETIRRFSKLIGRYLNADFMGDDGEVEGTRKTKSDDEDLLNKRFQKPKLVGFGLPCIDCNYILKKFCKIYMELEELKLMLGWQVRKLRDIVALSAKAPTRVRTFQKEISVMAGGEDGVKIREIEAFRKDFLRKCTLKFQRIQPRIHLKRKIADSAEKSSKRRLPGHIIGEMERDKIPFSGEDSQPIVDIIVKQEPGLVPTVSSEADLNPTNDNNVSSQAENFGEFDAHDDVIDIDYEYSTNDKKILPQTPPFQKSTPKRTPTTSPNSEPVISSNLDKLNRLVQSVTNKDSPGGSKPNSEEGSQTILTLPQTHASNNASTSTTSTPDNIVVHLSSSILEKLNRLVLSLPDKKDDSEGNWGEGTPTTMSQSSPSSPYLISASIPISSTPDPDIVANLPSNLEKLNRLVLSLTDKQNNSEPVTPTSQESAPVPLPQTDSQESDQSQESATATVTLIQIDNQESDQSQSESSTQDNYDAPSPEMHSPMGAAEGSPDPEDQSSETSKSTNVIGEEAVASASASTSGEQGNASGGQQKSDSYAMNLQQLVHNTIQAAFYSSPVPVVAVPKKIEPKKMEETVAKPVEAICSICNRKFQSAAQLAPHMYTHTEPKSWPFHCKYCNHRFYRVSDFKRHRVSNLHIQSKKVHKLGKSNMQRRRIEGSAPPTPSVFKRPFEIQPPTSSKVVILDQSPSTSASGLEERKNVKVVRIIYRAKDNSAAENKDKEDKSNDTVSSSDNNSANSDATQVAKGSSGNSGTEVVTID